MFRRAIRSLAVAVALVAAPACGDDAGGFQSPESPSSKGVIQGQAVMSGQPVGGVLVSLIDESGSIQRTRTDAGGGFGFQVAPAHYRLVLNDARGKGYYESLVVFGGGTNQLGALELVPLESVPGLIDLRGVGYEERLTREAGDYKLPVFNADRSLVYAARRLGGDQGYDLLKISVADGTETVLARDVDLGSSYSQRMFLLGDRILAVWADRQDKDQPQYRIESLVLLEAQTGRELYSIGWDDLGGYLVAGDRLYLLEAVDSREVGDTMFGPMHQYRYALLAFDLATGALERGSALAIGWMSPSPSVLGSDAGQAFIAVRRDCEAEFAMSNPGMCDDPFSGAGASIHRLDLVGLASRPVGAAPSAAGTLSRDGASLYLIDSGNYSRQAIVRMDIATGATTEVFSTDCGTGFCFSSWYGLDRSPVADEVLLSFVDRAGSAERFGIARVSLATGTITELPLDFTADGTAARLCEAAQGSSPSCSARYLPDGSVRLSDRRANGAGYEAWVVDLPAAGNALARRFAIGETDVAPEVLATPDGTRDLVLLRDLATGFFQAYAGPLGSSASALSPLTFLTAAHHDLALSPDGSWLFYFTRDPISGYEQLFRVATSAPDAASP